MELKDFQMQQAPSTQPRHPDTCDTCEGQGMTGMGAPITPDNEFGVVTCEDCKGMGIIKNKGDKMQRVLTEYQNNGSFSVNYYFERLERHETPFGRLEIGFNKVFGHLMFWDEEIQITTLDFARYHDTMAELGECQYRGDTLVIGDGDGGFTQYPWSDCVDYVERDELIMKTGEKYFNADWSTPRSIIRKPIEVAMVENDFVGKYDTILLAITDGFNRNSFEENIEIFRSWLKPHGKLVCQVAAHFDVNYKDVKAKYEKVGATFYDLYMPSFFSLHTFAVIKKNAQ